MCMYIFIPVVECTWSFMCDIVGKLTTRERRSLDVVYKGAPDIKHHLMRESGLDRACNNAPLLH